MSGFTRRQVAHSGRSVPFDGAVLRVEPLEERIVPSFVAPLSYAVGNAPLAALAADFDSDGILDLATANSATANVSVLRGRGDGLFEAARHYGAGQGVNSVATADFDGDGALDLATANSAAQSVSLLRGLGDGSFAAAVSFPAGPAPRAVTAGDFTNDGLADLVVLNPQAGTLGLLVNDGDGTFAGPTATFLGGDLRAAVAVELNDDNNLDLAVTKPDTSGLSILLGMGDGTFRTPTNVATGRFPTGATTADFNADRVPDLAVSTIDGATVLVGNGDGTFHRIDAPFEGRYYATAIAAGDLNGDGRIDLALGGADADARAIYGSLSVQLGNGDGTFDRVLVEDATLFAAHLTAGDFDGDGRDDLAAASYLRFCDDECSTLANSLLVLRSAPDGGWQRAPVYAGGRNPNAVKAGDFNRDGVLDLATVSFEGIGVLLGNSDGSFRTPRFAPQPRAPFGLAVGDFNGDGVLDVASTNPGSFPTYTNGTVNVLLGNGDGTFQPNLVLATGTNPAHVATGDVNGDGFGDLVAHNRSGATNSPASVTVLLGDGAGNFTQAETDEIGRGYGTVAVADLNGDGYADVAASVAGPGNSPFGSVYVLLSNGDGTLGPAVRRDTGGTTQSIHIADLNGDGVPDLAAGLAQGVSVLFGRGDGRFSKPYLTNLAGGAVALEFGDVDGDGVLDLAAASLTGREVSVLLGTGTGSFADPEPYAVRLAPRGVTAGDFDGDGQLDLAAASGGTWPSYSDGGVSILRNDGAWPMPWRGGLMRRVRFDETNAPDHSPRTA